MVTLKDNVYGQTEGISELLIYDIETNRDYLELNSRVNLNFEIQKTNMSVSNDYIFGSSIFSTETFTYFTKKYFRLFPSTYNTNISYNGLFVVKLRQDPEDLQKS